MQFVVYSFCFLPMNISLSHIVCSCFTPSQLASSSCTGISYSTARQLRSSSSSLLFWMHVYSNSFCRYSYQKLSPHIGAWIQMATFWTIGNSTQGKLYPTRRLVAKLLPCCTLIDLYFLRHSPSSTLPPLLSLAFMSEHVPISFHGSDLLGLVASLIFGKSHFLLDCYSEITSLLIINLF